jgi:dTDP-4-amino-4,6-dideoxygalactose transaminase
MADTTSRIYLSAPHMGGDELPYIHEAFTQNWIAPLGANVDGFEDDLEVYTGRDYAAVVTSGTAAIHLALRLCGVGNGDEVICQSLTFAATANPIRYLGATPVFIDSESETWNMDPDLLEQAIVDRISAHTNSDNGDSQQITKPKAIVVVHLYGMPAKMDRILQIASKYDIPVIEDAAEALGSSIGRQKCGSFGRFSVLSFNGNKIITTSGGGALLGDDEELIKRARFLATQARDQAPHYEHSELGYNYRMSNILAGIGRGQMKVLDQRVAARRANHDFYFNELYGQWLDSRTDFDLFNQNTSGLESGNGIYFLKEPEGYVSNRWLTAIIVNPNETGGITTDDIRVALEAENIESRPIWKPMHRQPLYSGFPYYGHGVSDVLFKFGLCLPSGSSLSMIEKRRIVSVIKKTLQAKGSSAPV